MEKKDLQSIEKRIKENIKKIAGNSGYGYLDCYEWQWKDASDYVHDLEEMSNFYLNNCLNEISKNNGFINLKFRNISKNIYLVEKDLTEEDKKEITIIGKRLLRELFDEKKSKIEEELSSR